MKTPITLKTSLLATTSIAAIGMAGLWAQEGTGKDAANDRRNESTKTAQAQNDERKQEYSGKLVSLAAHFGQQHGYSANKGREDKPGAPGSAETATASKTIRMENTPLGLLMSASTHQPGQPGQPGQTGQTGQPSQPGAAAGAALVAGERDSSGVSAQGQHLCVLLFDANNQHLAAKAHALCQSVDATSAGDPTRANPDADASEGAKGDQSRQSKSASSAKGHDAIKVSVSGKRVTRDGLTVIFVEDIQGAESNGLSR